jgi:hypothetical protein
MEDLAKAAQTILKQSRNNRIRSHLDIETLGFIQAVKNYASNNNSAKALADLKKVINRVRQDTDQIRRELSKQFITSTNTPLRLHMGSGTKPYTMNLPSNSDSTDALWSGRLVPTRRSHQEGNQ